MPKKVTKQEPETPVVPPQNAAEAEYRAITENQNLTFRAARSGMPTAVLPGGRRIDASPHIKARYRMRDMTQVFGAEEKIVSEDFKRRHPGYKYAWPILKGARTQAYIRAQYYKPVPFKDGIDHTLGLAMVMESPEGHAVWGQQVLVAVRPDIWHEEYDMPVSEAIGRTAMNRQSIEKELQAEFGKHGFKAEVQEGEHKQERIGD